MAEPKKSPFVAVWNAIGMVTDIVTEARTIARFLAHRCRSMEDRLAALDHGDDADAAHRSARAALAAELRAEGRDMPKWLSAADRADVERLGRGRH